jgi:hypothetical protein
MKNYKKFILREVAAIFAFLFLLCGRGYLAFDEKFVQINRDEFELSKQIQKNILKNISKTSAILSKNEVKLQQLKDMFSAAECELEELKSKRNVLDKGLAVLMQEDEYFSILLGSQNTWKNRRKKKAVTKKIDILKKEIDENEDNITKFKIILLILKNDIRKLLR